MVQPLAEGEPGRLMGKGRALLGTASQPRGPYLTFTPYYLGCSPARRQGRLGELTAFHDRHNPAQGEDTYRGVTSNRTGTAQRMPGESRHASGTAPHKDREQGDAHCFFMDTLGTAPLRGTALSASMVYVTTTGTALQDRDNDSRQHPISAKAWHSPADARKGED